MEDYCKQLHKFSNKPTHTQSQIMSSIWKISLIFPSFQRHHKDRNTKTQKHTLICRNRRPSGDHSHIEENCLLNRSSTTLHALANAPNYCSLENTRTCPCNTPRLQRSCVSMCFKTSSSICVISIYTV